MTMNKEIHRELRALKKTRTKISGDQFRANNALNKLDAAAIRLCKQTRAKIRREHDAVNHRCNRQYVKIERRIAILEGRLA